MENNIYLGITKKFADTIGIKKLNNIENYEPSINMWHGSLKYINRKKCIIFMNDLTRYTIFLYGIKKKDLDQLENLFIDGLVDTLRSDNFPHESIMKLVDNIESFNIIKTNNRSVGGSIMDHFKTLPYIIDFSYAQFMEQQGIINLKEISHKLNRTPLMCSSKGFFPIDKMKEYLIDGYDSKKDDSRRLDW